MYRLYIYIHNLLLCLHQRLLPFVVVWPGNRLHPGCRAECVAVLVLLSHFDQGSHPSH